MNYKYIKYIPNILTICRFVFIPFIIISIGVNNYLLAIILYTLSSVTDVVDGAIARKFNVISDFGKLMDPLADKINSLAVILTLTLKGIIPFWIFIILFLKELLMIIVASFLYGKDLVVSSKWYGKVTTVLLFIGVFNSLVIKMNGLPHYDIFIYALALVFAMFSLFSYYKLFYKKGYLPNKAELRKIAKPKAGPTRKHFFSIKEDKNKDEEK